MVSREKLQQPFGCIHRRGVSQLISTCHACSAIRKQNTKPNPLYNAVWRSCSRSRRRRHSLRLSNRNGLWRGLRNSHRYCNSDGGWLWDWDSSFSGTAHCNVIRYGFLWAYVCRLCHDVMFIWDSRQLKCRRLAHTPIMNRPSIDS